jgi:hypothetical protein
VTPAIGWALALSLATIRAGLMYHVKDSWNAKHWASGLRTSSFIMKSIRFVCGVGAISLISLGVVWIVFGIMAKDGMAMTSHWPGTVSFFVSAKSFGLLSWDFHRALSVESIGYAPIESSTNA